MNRRQGFTLIEMLVVMSVMALLLTIAVPRFFGSLNQSKEVALRENLQVMRITIDKFYADKGRYPLTLEELVELKYLRAVPTDPITESSGSWVLIAPREGDAAGVADVKSGAQGSTRGGTRYDAL